MYLGSSLAFGILLVLKASVSQSAPYIFQDSNDDEEEFIDRLASLAAVVGPEALSRHTYSNYIPPVRYQNYLDELNDDVISPEYLQKLPKQFAYRPDDVRFYLGEDQFPIQPNGEKLNAFDVRENEVLENPASSAEQDPQVQHNEEEAGGSESTQELYGHFMKKNDGKNEIHSHDHQLLAEPSNIMKSGHSTDQEYRVSSLDGDKSFTSHDIYYIGLVAGCSAAVVVGLVAAGIFWYRIHQRVKAAAEVDYPAYGVTGPSKDVSPSGGDRKLAQSAQMYHYQHQKQQMAALQKGALQTDREGSAGSDIESEDDNEDDNDYTVYECPGLAPAGEMEVKNPLFQDEPTPATPQIKHDEDASK